MLTITDKSQVKLELTLQYSSGASNYSDHYYCGDVNMWRDVFSNEHSEKLYGRKAGEHIVLAHNYRLVAAKSSAKKVISKTQWQPPGESKEKCEPRVGRWYPQGYLRDIAGIFPQMIAPFRVVDITTERMTIDYNHPLAGKDVQIEAHILEVSENTKERGGRCTDWLEEAAANGPGMQLFLEKTRVDYAERNAWVRKLEGEDKHFYKKPRFVNHIDSLARSRLLNYTTGLIRNEMRILDLMSSVESHLPDNGSVVGLGLNSEEMRKNPRLSEYIVHDLNTKPFLPFNNEEFDCVSCHLSFEYLLQPAQIIHECARVLTDNGLLIISISNRWFPEKVTQIWKMLHEFERLGYVLEHIRDEFTEIETVTYRNWPRPYDDPHYFTIPTSDPLFIASARKK